MMKILLDTHALWWFLAGDEKMSQRAINTISDEKNTKFVSIASLWEVALKLCSNKSSFIGGIEAFIKATEDSGFSLLDIEPAHIQMVANLPFIHRDPFDRMLIAQAIIGDMAIITADSNILKYNVSIIW
jgi:PIN domain nuclease of toxin-antitoxin system